MNLPALKPQLVGLAARWILPEPRRTATPSPPQIDRGPHILPRRVDLPPQLRHGLRPGAPRGQAKRRRLPRGCLGHQGVSLLASMANFEA